MKNVFVKIFTPLLCSFLLSSVAAASDNVIEKPVTADTPEKFAPLAANIRSEMQTGGRYEFIRASDKGKVDADLDAIAAMLQKSGSVGAMSESEKIRLFNTQEHLNGVLVHNDDNRLVCEHRAPVGSNIAITSCKTLGQIEKMHRDNQKLGSDLDGIAAKQCTGSRNCFGYTTNAAQH